MNPAKRLRESTRELTYVLTDLSPSMDCIDYEPTRKEGAILAVKEFVGTKAKFYPQDLVGLIGFDDRAHVIHHHAPVGRSTSSLLRALRNHAGVYESGTNFTAALLLAERCLYNGKFEPPHAASGFLKRLFFDFEPRTSSPVQIDSGFVKRVILLSDGKHNGGGAPGQAAQRLKETGVIIECIGIAGCPEEVDEKTLRAIASRDNCGNPCYSFIGDTHQLIRKYESMAHHLQVI